jgi:uncharacterized protein (TIGR02391 family)
MVAGTGPEILSQFEDRLLYHLVDVTGNRPLGLFQGISEADLAVRLAGELGIDEAAAASEEFEHSGARNMILAAAQNLKCEGVLEYDGALGMLSTIRPTLHGRRRVEQWRDEWAKRQQERDKFIQRRVLEELDRQRRANPGRYPHGNRLDIAALRTDLGIEAVEYLANARRLEAQGKITAYLTVDQNSLADGYAAITERGIQTLEATTAASRPGPDVQQAYVKVARLKRQLAIAERGLPSLIADTELRRRCDDLLAAEGDYDRVVREACVVLEDRIRRVTSLAAEVTGTTLMERAFGAKNPIVRLSTNDSEQRGAMGLSRGVMGFFRNNVGHHLSGHYTQEDALRLVAAIDLLLKLVTDATAATTPTTTS